jgi:hypothetical protein
MVPVAGAYDRSVVISDAKKRGSSTVMKSFTAD